MAVTAQLSPKIAIGGFVWSTFANQADWGASAAVKDVTTFEYVPFTNSVPGLKTLDLNTTAFNDYADDSLDEWLRNNAGTPQVTNLAPLGDTVGNLAVIANGSLHGGYRPFNASVGEVPTLQSVVGGGVIAEGLVTQSTTATVTATGHSTGQQVGALTAGHTVYAAVNVISVTGTTPSLTCQLESAATLGGAYTLRGSAGSAMTVPGGQWLSSTTVTTDSFWKLAFTVSGTTPVFTVFAAIAIV